MATDANVPGLGKTNKMTLGIGVISAGIVAVYVYIKHKDNVAKSAAAATASSPAAYGYSPYGYQGIASASPYGYGSYYGYGGGYGDYGLGGGGEWPGQYYGYQPTTTTGTGPGNYTTNGEWSQAALTAIGNNATNEAALGLYLAGLPVSATQENIITEAIGAVGPPPVSGANNYPPNIHQTGTTGQSGTITWKGVAAPGNKSLAQLQIAVDKAVPWISVVEHNTSLALTYEGRDIPKGKTVNLGFPASSVTG